MAKIKCETCAHWHGGFHLCLGVNADPRFKKGDQIYGPYASEKPPIVPGEKPRRKTRWERYWAENKERDEKIAELYVEGYGMKPLAAQFGIPHTTIASILTRLGVEIRKPGGSAGRTLLKKGNTNDA